MYVETERERERERLQRISEHENKKGGSSPLCVYNIRESESVCESEKESKKEREREREEICVSVHALVRYRESCQPHELFAANMK